MFKHWDTDPFMDSLVGMDLCLPRSRSLITGACYLSLLFVNPSVQVIDRRQFDITFLKTPDRPKLS